MTANCQWCGAPTPQSRQAKRFCTPSHRGNFHEACRLFGNRMFAEGAVSIEQLRAEKNTAGKAVDGAPGA